MQFIVRKIVVIVGLLSSSFVVPAADVMEKKSVDGCGIRVC